MRHSKTNPHGALRSGAGPRRPWLTLACCGALVGLIGASGCGDDADLQARQVNDYVQNVQSSDGQTQGALVEGAPPEPSGGPTATAEVGSATVVQGDETPVTVESDVPFASLVVFVAEAAGFYQLTPEEAVDSLDLLLGLSEDAPQGSFPLIFTVIDGEGRVGEWVIQTMDVQVRVRPGDGEGVQCAAWESGEQCDGEYCSDGESVCYYTVDGTRFDCNCEDLETCAEQATAACFGGF